MSCRLPSWILPAILFFAFGLLSLPAGAQGTLADYQRAEQFLPGNLQKTLSIASVYPNWIEKSDRFWYLKMGPSGKQFILVDAAQNTAGPAFDQARLAAALSRTAGKPYRADNLPFFDFEYVQNDKAISFAIDQQQWSCTLADYQCKSTPPEAGVAPYESLSPNGEWAAFVRDHNLFVRHVSTGAVVQLTRDGVPGWDYATPLPDLRALVTQNVPNGEDVKASPEVFWSPDSTKLVAYRLDSRNAGRFTSLQYVPPKQLRPMAYNYVYPLPGEILPQAAPIIFDLESGKRIDVKTSPLEIQFIGGPGFRWFPDSQRFYYRYDERGEKATDLREVDAQTGEQKVLIREVAKPYPYVDPGETFSQFFDDDKQILWSSERDGWNQLYVYNASTGKLENQVTHGSWVVREIAHVDAKRGYVYFLASGVQPRLDPYYTQLYRVKLDGSGMKLLTPEDADHTVSISSDGDYFVDNYSRPDSPGEAVLRRASDGSVVRVLERTVDAALVKMGWKKPIPFEGKAADGKTDLYGIIVRPTNFDPAKKYPILENIYTGPQGFFVPKTFGAAMRLQSMAELGFVVVMVDGRGTTGRSREFHDFSYHNMGNVFIDHVAMIKQMAAKYPWMEITRVGIFGTSAGGYGSAHAFLQFPDFYKVCVSTSGDHDPRLDKAWWNELYQGYPVGKDYAEQANQALASNLQGHLLLIHGDIDDNVNPTETMHLVDALMTANKNFDMLFVPNMFHGDSGPHAHYVTRRRWDYFVQYLLGVTPPKNFEIHEAPFFFAFRRR
ncbi:MAG TPA: DPP IV N-terminal domain-containing protein [Candidatus Acidoferrales bacterium]|nr:DPP IV N-terminal domain-containing protein [Candidatus Acidoferrales bacterium]